MRGSRTRWAVALAGWASLALGSGDGLAADQIVLGHTLAIKDPVPGQPVNRTIKVAAREKAGATIVGDPTVGGATLRVIANGGTPTDETYTLPASGWSVRTTASGHVRLRYRDKGLNGPVKGVDVQHSPTGTFSLKAGAFAKIVPINVVPPNPGTDGAIVFSIVGGDTYCSGFGGAAGGYLVNDPPGNPFKHFAVKKPVAEIGACPP